MAVLQMKKIRICAVRSERKALLEFLQRQGCVEVHHTDSCSVFSKTDTESARAIFKKSAQDAAKSVEILAGYCPEKTSLTDALKGRKVVDIEYSGRFYQKITDVLKTAQRIIKLDRLIEEQKGILLKIEEQEEALAPWQSLPVAQTFKGTRYTRVLIGSMDGANTAEQIVDRLLAAGLNCEAVHIEVVYTSRERTYCYLITRKDVAKEAEDALRLIDFAYLASPLNGVPRELMQGLQEQKRQMLETLQAYETEIRTYEPLREDLRFLQDHMTMREEKYSVIERLAQSRHTFVLSGYISAPDLPGLEQTLLERFDCIIETADAADDENAPVKLHNNRLVRPGELVLESYSMPNQRELDPTSLMSVFYYVMFGLMFSDAGYGLIMAAACAACLLSFKRMEEGTKRFLSLFFWCGISTVFWGVVFSSYFGDVVNVVSKVFFGKEVGIPPLWFAPLEDPMKLLIFCLGIGILHLVAGYVMKALNQAKSGHYADILYDVCFPIVILFCFVVILMGSGMFYDMAGFRLSLSPSVNNICLGLAGICMTGVVLTGGRESKNWIKRLLKGIYALYNVLAGWLGDILSYSRLLALGLATGVIASVINALGSMVGSGVIGAVIFTLVFLVGHALNFGINVLGAYVHSNRLEYVEFFGKFYEGGGRKFLPYGIHTKYYTIEEVSQNV